MKEVEEEIKKHVIENEDLVAQYHLLVKLEKEMMDEFNQYIMGPKYCLRFLVLGRLVWVKYNDMDFGWNMVVRYEELRFEETKYGPRNSEKIIDKVIVLLQCSNDSFISEDGKDICIKPGSIEDNRILVIKI